MKFANIIFVFVIGTALGLKNSDTGYMTVCKELVKTEKTRYQSYIETYRKYWGPFYKTRTRLNWKVVPYTEVHFVDVCCTGNEEVNGMCKPVCDPPCGQGICLYPNACSCSTGYQRGNSTTDYVCEPICPNGCEHGYCSAPSVCSCDKGYIFNSYTCEPFCSEDCKAYNAYCKGPNQCECIGGYKWTVLNNGEESADIVFDRINKMCVPACSVPCTNGNCTAPNTCTCYEGYVPDVYDPYVCLPVCEGGCRFGQCTGPNECTCDPGYTKLTWNDCTPVCSKGCKGGYCIAPETCNCYEGYAFADGLTECEPICEKTCINGTCTSPGECTCHEGFRKSSDESLLHICEPHCERSCEPYASCTAPNTCTCFDGFRLVDKAANRTKSIYFEDNSLCEPICNLECINGYCSAPDVCSCNPGYNFLKNSTNECEPTCEQTCLGGYCSEPHKCKCNPGYKAVSSDICKPVCNQSCVNGFCIRPDTCSCLPGYEFLNDTTCKPICSSCGPNQICSATEQCSCENGYRPSDDGTCEPFCESGCRNGTCTAPDMCTCNEGYEKGASDECKPFCTHCGNGTCIEPEVCQCDEGFILEKDIERNSTSCIPFCGDCTDGDCVAPDNCECHKDYMKNTQSNITCVKICDDDCNNHGTCMVNNTCHCFDWWQGDRCDEEIFCKIEIGEDNRTTLITLDKENTTYLSMLRAISLCSSECGYEISNASECFVLGDRNTTDENSITCLIEKDPKCGVIYGSSTNSGNLPAIAGIVTGSLLAILLIVAAVYLVFTRRQQAALYLGTIPSRSLERRPTLLTNENEDL